MGHHDTSGTSDQTRPIEKGAQQGSGDLTGAPDQGGSGQTSEPRMGQQPSSDKDVSQEMRDAERAAFDPKGSDPKPR